MVTQFLAKFFPKNGFSRNIIVLVSGTALWQAAILLAAPIISRIYSPVDFGSYAIFATIISVLSVSIALYYENAIPIAEENEVRALLWLSSIIIVLTSSIIGSVVWVFRTQVIGISQNEMTESILLLIPVSLVMSGVFQMYSAQSTRQGKLSLIARYRALQGISTASFQIGLGRLLDWGPMGLVVGHVLGQLGGFSTIPKSRTKRQNKEIRLTYFELKEIAYKYRHFSLFGAPGYFLNSLASQMPILIVSGFFSAFETGILSMTIRIFAMPAMLISSSIYGAFLNDMARFYREGNVVMLNNTFKRVLGLLIWFSAIIILPFGLLAPIWTPIVLGKQWEDVGLFALILTPAFMAQFVGSPLDGTLIVLEQQKLILFMSIIRILVVVVPISVGGYIGISAVNIVIVLSFSLFIYYVYLTSVSWKALQRYSKHRN